jgi:sigma-B regulation protein RsbU (phosphoserine phosphatase)
MKRNLLFPFVCLLVVGLAAEWLIDKTVSRKAVSRTADSLLLESAARIGDRTVSYLNTAVNLAQADAALAGFGGTEAATAANLKRSLWLQLAARPDIDIVSIGFSTGEYVEAQRLADGRIRSGSAGAATGGDLVLERTDGEGRSLETELRKPGYDPRERPWYLSAEKSGHAVWSAPYALVSSGETVMSVGVPAYEDGRLLAVATADLALGRLSSFLSTAASIPGALAFLVNEEGFLVASSDSGAVDAGAGRLSPVFEAGALAAEAWSATRADPGVPVNVDAGGAKYRAVQLPLSGKAGLSWRLVIAFPASTFSTVLDETDRLSLAVLFVTLVLALVFGFGAARRVSQPLRDLGLSLAAMDLGAGQTPPDLSALMSREDEIGRLASSFHELATRLQENFSKLSATVQEKELLLKELNHRVKNNLQIVSSLISTQAGATTDEATTEGLRHLQDRILTMAYVHDDVYHGDNIDLVDMDRYLGRICESLTLGARDTAALGSREGPGSGLKMEVSEGRVALGLDQALPCGLVVNELVANCMKHAFVGRASGRVSVSLGEARDHRGYPAYRLVVEDDGRGMAEARGAEAGRLGLGQKGMGSILVEALSSQLRGGLKTESGPTGTRMTLFFPKDRCEG